MINILAADKLLNAPKLYATFLLWLLSELYENLPEVGDPEKPKLVFFFDEAHLLFKDAPAPLLQKVEQVVRLIRSKGVGVYFVTQNPLDVPETVLGQLGNRVQHALASLHAPRPEGGQGRPPRRSRPNPKIDAAKAITELEVGEALVSMLDEKGSPRIVERGYILPPPRRSARSPTEERQAIIKASVVHGTYETMIDRESAYEMLKARAEEKLRRPRAFARQRRRRTADRVRNRMGSCNTSTTSSSARPALEADTAKEPARRWPRARPGRWARRSAGRSRGECSGRSSGRGGEAGWP